MKIFISGATGVLGRRVVRRLVEGDHTVIGLSRSPSNSDWLRNNGAEARSGDLFDQESINDLTSDSEGILHLATAIPTKARTTTADWKTNDRIRREGTRNLVGAAKLHSCKLYIQQSLTLIYGEQNGNWVDEKTPLPDPQPSILESAVDMEKIVREAMTEHDLPAIILRFGSFYSHDSAQTRDMLQLVQKGFFPIVGDGSGYWNLIHVDDAAEAVVKAVENYEAGLGQTFNVCDDEPVPYGELLRFIAERLGARKPMRIPRFLANWMLGSHVVESIFSSFRGRNQSVKELLDWIPHFQTYREGYQDVIDKWLDSLN